MGKLRAKSWLWLIRGWGKKPISKPTIGVLTFEVSRFMSKAINIWRSLSDDRITELRDETLRLQGIRKLISDDDDFLLGLALSETMDSVHLLSRAVSRLGARCTDPILRSFAHVFTDLIKNDSDLCRLEFSHRRMDRCVKKMERFVSASANLHQELDVLAEAENDLRRMQATPECSSLGTFKKRVVWQRQAVRSLQDVSVWNLGYDHVTRLLARAVFTIVARIKLVFGFQKRDSSYSRRKTTSLSFSGGLMPHSSDFRKIGTAFASGPLMAGKKWGIRRRRTQMPASSNFTEWNGDGDGDGVQDEDPEAELNLFSMNQSLALFESRRKLMKAPATTLGAAALAMHYANLIILIEKLAISPNSIGTEVRDGLYSMLTQSIREALRGRLRSYAKNLGSSIYDPSLAEEWSDAVGRILEWLAPLAHNMVKWQTDRNFEQQHMISCSNVLLLQTLYYANLVKAEAAITELLVGLNYLWRFGRELNARAVMRDCVGSQNVMPVEMRHLVTSLK